MKKIVLASILALTISGCSGMGGLSGFNDHQYYALVIYGPSEPSNGRYKQNEYSDDECIHEFYYTYEHSVSSNHSPYRLCTGGSVETGLRWPPPEKVTFNWKRTREGGEPVKKIINLREILKDRKDQSAMIIIKVSYSKIQVSILEKDKNNCWGKNSCHYKPKSEKIFIQEK